MEMRRKQPIGVELVKRVIVTEGDIDAALQYQRDHQNQKLGDILYTLEACEPNKLINAIGEILGTKGIILNVRTLKVKLTDYISLDVAKQNKAIPIEVSSGKIKVCFASTANKNAMDTVAKEFGDKVNGVPYIVIGDEASWPGYQSAFDDDIKKAIKKAYENEDYKDIVAPLINSSIGEKKDEHSNDTIITVAILVVLVGGIGCLVYFSRKKQK